MIAGSSNFNPSQLTTSMYVNSALSFVNDGSNNDIFIASVYSSTTYGFGTSSNGYVGVQFEISGQVHYGWIRINSVVTSPQFASIEILDYAYEDCPGTQIQVGATSGGASCPSIEDLSLSFVGEYTFIPFD